MENTEKKPIVAYKVFNPDWTCRGKQYEVGKEYREDKISICNFGIHACLKLSDCFSYYSFNSNNKVAEVLILGEYETHEDDSKIVTDWIKIEKELSWEEVLRLCNSGNWNSGNWNSGNGNSGNGNSGNGNSGNWNSGNWNSGDWNSGDWNSGNGNSGNRNSGDWNSGNWNSGDWNSGDWNSGILNNTDSDIFRVFNTWIKKDEFNNIIKPNFFYFDLTYFISHDVATQEEKDKYKKEIEVCGGFLKTLSYKEAFKLSYSKASKEDKELVKKIPGFDKDIFFDISGIDVDKD